MCIICTGLEQTDSKMYFSISFLSKERSETVTVQYKQSVASEQQGSSYGSTHSAPAGVGLYYRQNN